ncbi:uncharacterized protein L969DRAFT_92451 [Mixia osmundae IAM 14324]|uniref:Uncharacterized protein n=1 Tax=Mixia osmundae (strain CBS 9802 / IAM 14324 / JCM 22182 / KY 12970) TaxID=764103 RepID=G7DXI0_MIXOS|nr:uncharacterized protein L969DRAFT_92451 [Mixia osmundae IAM 14324]KEI41216.1 hypothetical protein L969DRAFT_92451 [Mixia osmundae IAM 14324]GAA95290.1 hypothetical protein E5Q_01946 [Mixia osmundae IAM 14324]
MAPNTIAILLCLVSTLSAIPLPTSKTAIPYAAPRAIVWDMSGTITVSPTQITATKVPGPPFNVKRVAAKTQTDEIWHDVMFEAYIAYGCYTFFAQRTVRFHASPTYRFEELSFEAFTLPDFSRPGCRNVSPGKRTVTPAENSLIEHSYRIADSFAINASGAGSSKYVSPFKLNNGLSRALSEHLGFLSSGAHSTQPSNASREWQCVNSANLTTSESAGDEVVGGCLAPTTAVPIVWEMTGTVTVSPKGVHPTKNEPPPFNVNRVDGYNGPDGIWHDVKFEAYVAYSCYTFYAQRTMRFHASPTYKFEQLSFEAYTVPDSSRPGCQHVSPGRRNLPTARNTWEILPISNIAIA